MNKNIVSAKLKRQMAEIQEMIELLKESAHSEDIIAVLEKQKLATEELIQTINEDSFMPREVESLDIEPEIKKIEKKIDIAKEGAKKIGKLQQEIDQEKKKITKKTFEEDKN